MGMLSYLALVLPEQVEALLARPKTVDKFVNRPDLDDDPQFFAAGKTAAALQYVFTGKNTPQQTVTPLDFMMAGGTNVGDIDVGGGPARVFTAAQLSTIATQLAAIPIAKLTARTEKTEVSLELVTELRMWITAGVAKQRGLIVWSC